MNNLLLRVMDASDSLVPKKTYQWQPLDADLQQSPAEFIKLQRRYNDQTEYLKTLSNTLALLEDQLKQMEYANTVAGNCKQCLGKSLNLCGQCVLHIGGYIGTKNQHSGALEHTQKHFRDLDKNHDKGRGRDRDLDKDLDKDLDNGQEDAYWL
jgi:hypothetical protein